MTKNFYLKSFVIAGLRRLTYKYPARNRALAAARVERGLYKCVSCGLVKKKKEVQIDHIDPVIDTKTGWVDFNTFIDRLFCPVEGFQVLCKEPCHRLKTELEDNIRTIYKKKTSKKKKKS